MTARTSQNVSVELAQLRRTQMVASHSNRPSRHRHATTTAAALRFIAALVVAAVSLACSAPRDDEARETEPTSSTRDPLAPGASIVCGVTDVGGRPELEFYMLYAMNHKLRYYPEFASAIGVDLVSDCEGARRFMEAYAEYSMENPGFDADEPLPEIVEEDPPPPPEDGVGVMETQKILNGVGERIGFDPRNHPVVKIAYQLPDMGDDSWGKIRGFPFACTGTFINKNWILTAAHCLSGPTIRRCLVENIPREECEPDFDQWTDWEIVGFANTKPDEKYHIKVWARGYVHDQWLGRTNPGEFHPDLNPDRAFTTQEARLYAERDQALLYVSTSNDHVLPPVLEQEALDDGAKRLSPVEPDTNWPMRYYGWGNPNTNRLDYGATTMVNLQSNGRVIEGKTMTLSSAAILCEGDSGGPLVRTGLTLPTNLGEKQGLEAIVAVASISTGQARDPDTPDEPSDCEVGQVTDFHRFFWSVVDLEFVENKMRRWPPYSAFECKKRVDLDAGLLVAECWGHPCTGTGTGTGVKDCADDEVCSQSGRSISAVRDSCSACDGLPEAGTCGCIVGQCLPLPEEP